MIGVWCLRSECGLSKTLWFFYMMVERAVIAKIIPTTYWMGIPGSAQSLSHVGPFATPWTAAHQASLSISNSWRLLKLTSIESVMPSNHLTFVVPFSSCLQSFPTLGSFQVSLLFISGGQIMGVSASTLVLAMNIQDWFPFGWTGWISLLSKGLSRVFSNTTVQKHQFFGT